MRGKKSQERGFTLVELAIVLVIIGIIIGAVLKGQDLITNARAKKFVNAVKAWEISQWTYMDRKGRFAGDEDKNGKIGDGTTNTVKADLTGASFINPPYEGTGNTGNSITMGSYTFYVFFGTDAGDGAGKNIMILCKSVACADFTAEELVYIEAFDVAMDGSSDPDDGQIIGVDTAPTMADANDWNAYYGSVPTLATAWAATTNTLVYYFDAKR